VCGFCRVFKMHTALKVVPARAIDLHRMGRGVSPLRHLQIPEAFLIKFFINLLFTYYFIVTSYRLNTFRALLCPSSGDRDYNVDYHIGRLVLDLLEWCPG